MPDIASPLPQYVTNVACTVRVDGVPVRVPASTHLPAGVSQSEIERLLRFNVIRVYEPEAEPEAADEPKLAPEPVAVQESDTGAAKAVVRRSRKKATDTAVPDTEE